MSDRGLVDAALMEHLANDATLMALCPDGVYWGAPHPGSTAYVIVALFDGTERPGLDGTTLYERTVYLVKAVMLSKGGSEARLAAARIHALLNHVDLDLSSAGYQSMLCRRLEPLRLPPELDPDEKSARWQHVGGQYELWSYPAEAPAPPAVSYAELVLADGASHYWRLGETAGSIAADHIGSAPGTISGGVTLGQPGAVTGDTSMLFNGTTGQILTAAPVTLSLTATIEAWVLFTVDNIQMPFFSIREEGIEFLYVGVQSNNPFVLSYQAGNSSVHGVTNIRMGWHHLAVIIGAATVTFYVDGVFGATGTFAGTRTAITDAAMIGWNTDTANFWNGAIDEVAIYQMALTPAQIAAHYAARTG